MSITWPDILKPRSISHEIRNAARSGGPGLEGGEQRAFSPGAARWAITYDEIAVYDRQRALAWWALVDQLRSGEEVVAKVYNLWRAKGAEGADPEATADGAYAAGVVEMDISASGLTLEPGVMFSVGERLYRISRIVSETASLSLVDILLSDDKVWSDTAIWVEDGTGGTAYTVRFLPPLRQSVADGAALDFVDLKCLCVLDDLASGDLKLDLGKFAAPSIALREA
jgi:hypothetical protein